MTKKIQKSEPLILPLPIPVLPDDPDPSTLAEPVIYVKGNTGQLRFWDSRFGVIPIVWDIDIKDKQK